MTDPEMAKTLPWVSASRLASAPEKYMRNKPPAKSTLTVEPTDSPMAALDLPVVLWVPALRHEVELPALPSYLIGREGADVNLNHDTVSRRHLSVMRVQEGLRVTDMETKNGTWINEPGVEKGEKAVRVTSTTLIPGQAIKIGQLRVWPLTTSQRNARRQLAHALGHGPEADQLVMELLGDARAARSLVVLGDPLLEPLAVVNAFINASPRAGAKRRDLTVETAPTAATDIRDLAAGMQRGVVTIDVEVLSRAGEHACAAWQATLGNPHWNLMVIWHGVQRVAEWPTRPRGVVVPTVRSRVVAGELGLMVEHLMRVAEVGWRLEDLHRVELYPRMLERYHWDGGHPEFRLMVDYARLSLAGMSHAAIAAALKMDRGTLKRYVDKWMGRRT